MSRMKILCALGKFDIPIIQMQPPFIVDLLDSNIAVFGSAMSGKTFLIKTLINILHKKYNEGQERIFLLDFGGALAEYKEFPLVSAYFDNSNEEYVKRVFRIMENILKENIEKLNGRNYRDAEQPLLHTTFIIDNLNAFLDEPRYSAYQEKLGKLCRDGLSKGITILVTAAETKGINPFLGSFKQKIAFEMPQDKYAEIFSGKAGMIGNNPGHGFANVTVQPEGITGTFRMNLPYEVQCFLPYKPAKTGGGADSEEEFFSKLRQKFGFADGKYTRCAKKYRTFPKELTAGEYEKLKQNPEEEKEERKIPVSVGLDYVNFCPITVDLGQSHVIAIYGKRDFGKTNLLSLLLEGLLGQKTDLRLVFLDDGRKQLEGLYRRLNGKAESEYFNGYQEGSIKLGAAGSRNGTADPRPEVTITRKLSPLQRFYLYLNENYLQISKKVMGGIFGITLESDCNRIQGRKEYPDTPFTVFIIQSKLVYLNTMENRYFIEKILPQMAAVAEDRGYLFLFSDVQKINEPDTNAVFNNTVSTVFLLDNIAEFAGERGQRTVFGNMDVKALKEDYARCEKGDGYFYDIEADTLLKAKFIKYEKGE